MTSTKDKIIKTELAKMLAVQHVKHCNQPSDDCDKVNMEGVESLYYLLSKIERDTAERAIGMLEKDVKIQNAIYSKADAPLPDRETRAILDYVAKIQDKLTKEFIKK